MLNTVTHFLLYGLYRSIFGWSSCFQVVLKLQKFCANMCQSFSTTTNAGVLFNFVCFSCDIIRSQISQCAAICRSLAAITMLSLNYRCIVLDPETKGKPLAVNPNSVAFWSGIWKFDHFKKMQNKLKLYVCFCKCTVKDVAIFLCKHTKWGLFFTN